MYRRERSKRWQAAFVIDGHTIRISTGKRDLAEAKEYARDTFLEYKFRHKNDLPVVTKKFSDVAKLAIADMPAARCKGWYWGPSGATLRAATKSATWSACAADGLAGCASNIAEKGLYFLGSVQVYMGHDPDRDGPLI